MSDVEDPIDMGSEAGDDLFGGDDDVSQNEATSPKDQIESDGLASDLDEEPEERASRRYASEDQREEEQQKIFMDLTLYRHKLPRADDGEFRSFRVPQFIKINPQQYDPSTFEPTEWDVENARNARPKPVVRCRVNPSTGELESNALIHRWSDGSVTLSIGDEQFEIQRKYLAPQPNGPYDQLKDAHYYAAAAHLSTNILVTVGHVTEQFMVKPNQLVEDDGIAAFKSRMAKERAARLGPTVDAEALKLTQLDPEGMKRAAELAERERAKAQRRRESAQARQGGYGSRYAGGGGLSVDDLERGGGRGKGGIGGSRKRGVPGDGKQKRYRPEYDSDDEPGAMRRGDNYDYDDGFLARSDEEISEDEDEEEEDILDDEEEERRPRRKRQRTAESEEDAEGEADDDDAPPEHARHRRRQVIDEDDEEEN
ncbi:uncharacterized protein MKZ38_003296 [Zalerion maritima]|uniref:RNA polymerase-associated protein LEO1 n=1 Tax=Zalerion maritima TaxID=339359 RepID=A0AAD5RPG0_9PEZI|nr:uncharacterized protein MKZ38_003296 [Zalerion maritima]